jgi:transcriptional regulator with XRE-family HTH domain
MRYITKALKEKGVTQQDIMRDFNASQPYASSLINGKRVIGKKTAEKLSELYGLDFAALLRNEDDAEENEEVKDITNQFYDNKRPAKRSNAKILGPLDPDEDEEGNTRFREISPGRYRMRVPLVTQKARAGFLRGFRDEEYIEELPIHEVTVDFFYKSRYFAIEAEGDSMDDRTIYAIPDKTVLTCRVLNQEMWKPKLHVHNFPNWVIVHKRDGVLVKQIAEQDLEKGYIVLSSLNPDKDLYPDYRVEVKDILMIMNVVKRELPF